MASQRAKHISPLINSWRNSFSKPRTATTPIFLRLASTKPQRDKSRILEKPTRFNPPSHGRRLPRGPRNYGPQLTDAEQAEQDKKRYPNMMPPEGSLMFKFLTNRRLHLFITMGVLVVLGVSAMFNSFLYSCAFRDELPAPRDFLWKPFSSLKRFINVYKMHIEHQSAIVAEKRQARNDDARKRQEFLREHGVDPGFLTGTWMDKFGTVEGDKWKEERAAAARKHLEEQQMNGQADAASPVAVDARSAAGLEGVGSPEAEDGRPREKPKRKVWLGIW